MNLNLSGKTLLITGGTGSLGIALLDELLTKFADVRQIIVYSRDEFKQFELSQRYTGRSEIKWRIGDVADYERLKHVCKNVDIIFHLAAMKQVPACELNPDECIKTNIVGTQNLIRVANETGVKKVLAVSTDKAVKPVNAYGGSKLIMEKLIRCADAENADCKFSVVRFGNFAMSRGSVIPLFLAQKSKGLDLSITDPSMTRFCISEQEAASCLLKVLQLMKGSEIFIPKMKSYRICDIARVISNPGRWKVTGLRLGERMHEELICPSEGGMVVETEQWLIMLFSDSLHKYELLNCKIHTAGFSYRSDLNNDWYTQEDIKRVLVNYELISESGRYRSISTTCTATTKTSSSETTKSATSTKSTAESATPVTRLPASS